MDDLVSDSAANDKDKERHKPLEKQGLEKGALDKADVHDARNAGAADIKSAEAVRTNASNGSLQDRRRLMAQQDESIEIVGFQTSASRHSKLKEKDLLASHIIERQPEQVGPQTFSLGLAYEEHRTFSQKFVDFAEAASRRLFNADEQKAFTQEQIDKILGIGEGLNIAKEHAKESVKVGAGKAWNAFADGTVASFLARPNAINDPLFKAVGGTLDAMSKDPNLVNKVLVVIEHQIERENARYSSMEPHEKGRFIGEIMFNMVNPEGSTEAAEASLKIADRLAIGAEKSERFVDDLRGVAKAGAGAGVDWKVLDKRLSVDVIRQTEEMSCVSACGEMISDGNLKQSALIKMLGTPTATEMLADCLGPGWKGGAVGVHNLDTLLRSGPWVADLRPPVGPRYVRLELAHAVVVDGLDNAGNIMVRDPEEGFRYEMTRAEFARVWTQVAVFRQEL